MEGRALYHEGVAPAANWEAIWLETAPELVRASATRDEGSAVWRTLRTETLGEDGVSHEDWGWMGRLKNSQVLALRRALSKSSGREGGEGEVLELHCADGIGLSECCRRLGRDERYVLVE